MGVEIVGSVDRQKIAIVYVNWLWGRHCHCPNFHCHYNQRHQNVCPHVTHKISPSCRTFLRKAMIVIEWKQREYLSEWSVCCSLLVLKIGGHGRSVNFVTWDPSILRQAVDNLEAKSEPDQLTNACAERRVRKRRNAWPVNNAWESNDAFLRCPTARC